MTTINITAPNFNRRKTSLTAGLAAAAACILMAPSALFASCGIDLATQFNTQLGNQNFHAGSLTQTVTIKNMGGPAKGTIYFEVDNLPQGVSVQNLTWTAGCQPGAQFIRVYLGPNNEWAGGATKTLQLRFLGTKKPFTYTYRVIRGTGLPNPHAVTGDYDGDHITDFALFNPVTSTFTIKQSSNNLTTTTNFGWNNVTPRFLLGDFDGDLIEDLVVYNPANSNWAWKNSSDGIAWVTQFGAPNLDLPIPGDYDGDSYTDVAYFNPPTSTFVISRSSDKTVATKQFGQPGDIPVPADYDGDGTTDIAVFTPALNQFKIQYSSTQQIVTFSNALLAGIPFAADFNGDGKADMAAYNSLTGNANWVDLAANVVHSKYVGIGKPVAADFNGDGHADIGLYDPTSGYWALDSQMMNPGPNQVANFKFGTANQDVPTMAVPAGLKFPNLLPW